MQGQGMYPALQSPYGNQGAPQQNQYAGMQQPPQNPGYAPASPLPPGWYVGSAWTREKKRKTKKRKKKRRRKRRLTFRRDREEVSLAWALFRRSC